MILHNNRISLRLAENILKQARQRRRELLIKHAGLLKENKNFHQSTVIKDDLIQQRAGITKSDKNIAKQVVNDLEIKKRLTK